MQHHRKAPAQVVRGTALALLFAMAGAGAWSACSTSESPAPAEVDLGPTFGAEVTVAIKGRGRVVSLPTVIDCPSHCFARIVLDAQQVDGASVGLSLSAEATSGSHFAGWSYQLVDLGGRARGPSQCSPMKRSTAAPAFILDSPRVVLPYGETKGTPPRGLEAECAEFTTVPVAYALTANFVDEDGGQDVDAGIEKLYEPPRCDACGTNVIGRELGVTGGRVYWRFDKGTLSGIAAGSIEGGGDAGVPSVLFPPTEAIPMFDVDRHVLLQNAQGQFWSIQAAADGTDTKTLLATFSSCASLASDAVFAYCRYTSGGAQTYLYSWPIGGGSASQLYALPRGNQLAVDKDRIYFSDEVDGAVNIESAWRPEGGTGGFPTVMTLGREQSSPRAFSVGPSDLFWIDGQGAATTTFSLPKGGGDVKPGFAASNVRFVVADPTAPTIFWVGLPSTQRLQSVIVRASTSSGSVKAFLANLPSLGGIAVDATHVYWTQTDGRVFRAPKR